MVREKKIRETPHHFFDSVSAEPDRDMCRELTLYFYEEYKDDELNNVPEIKANTQQLLTATVMAVNALPYQSTFYKPVDK